MFPSNPGKRPIAWVTGAAGFLGGHVAHRLQAEGWSVVGMGGLTEGAGLATLAAGYPGPITASMLEQVQRNWPTPQLVVHAAGTGSVGAAAADPLRAFERTVSTTAVLLDHLRRHAPDARVLYPSSAAVYGVNPGDPLREDGPLHPASTYGWHKLMAEHLLRDAVEIHDQPCCAIRFFSIYGPGLRKQVLWDWSQRILGGESPLRLAGSGREIRDFLYVDDAVALILHLARLDRKALPGVINGGSGEGATMANLAAQLSTVLGRSVDVRFEGQVRAGDPPYYLASTQRLRALGIACPVPLGEGLARYAEWVRTVV